MYILLQTFPLTSFPAADLLEDDSRSTSMVFMILLVSREILVLFFAKFFL